MNKVEPELQAFKAVEVNLDLQDLKVFRVILVLQDILEIKDHQE